MADETEILFHNSLLHPGAASECVAIVIY